MARRPHIILFNVDQWRADALTHLGNPARAIPGRGSLSPQPVLDRWVAEEAVSFRNAYVQSPVCTPSRCSFMTGWYPHVRGHRTIDYLLQPDEPELLRSLKEAGYFVWWGGKNDLVAPQHGYAEHCSLRQPPPGPERPCLPNLHAVQSWRSEPGSADFYSFYAGRLNKPASFPADEPFVYDADWHTVLGAIEFLRHAPPDQPLCLFLALHNPHPPFGVEEPWFSLVDRSSLPPRIPLPADWTGKPSMLSGIVENQQLQDMSEAQWDDLRAVYYGMCARLDHQFGLLLGALSEAGLYDDSAVFFFADHGEFLGDYGIIEKAQNTFEDALTRVPLLVKPPSAWKVQPGVREALVELVDLPATVYALADLTPTYTHFGRSLLPVITGETQVHREMVFCEGGRVHGETHAMEPLDEKAGRDWLYWPRLDVQHREGPEHTKAIMCRTPQYKYVYRLYEEDEFYDLRADPHEQCNLAAMPEHTAAAAWFREQILRWLVETGDVVPHTPDKRW